MRAVLFLLIVALAYCGALQLFINRPNNANTASPTDSNVFESDPSTYSTIKVGFNSVFWPVDRYSNLNSATNAYPIICHGEVVWSSASDAQSLQNSAYPRERNCWNRDWSSPNPISYTNCLQKCDPDDNDDITLPWNPPSGCNYDCRTFDSDQDTYCECRSCQDTKVLPIAYIQPAIGDEDVNTSHLRMTVAGAISNGMQVLFTLWDSSNRPIITKTIANSLVYSAPESYCSDRIEKFEVGISMNPSTIDSTNPKSSGWFEGERCQLHQIDFQGTTLAGSTLVFNPQDLYWVTIEFRNSYYEIYTSVLRNGANQYGKCDAGLFGRCVPFTYLDSGIAAITYQYSCDYISDSCPGTGGSVNTPDATGNSNDQGSGHAWISGISFQFISDSVSVPCDTLWERGIVTLVSGDERIRADKCDTSSEPTVPNWTCDVCQNYLSGHTECTDETTTTSNGLQIWRKEGKVTVFSGLISNFGVFPNLNESDDKIAYLGMMGVILNPNTVLSMTTLLTDGTTFHWFSPKVSDFTNPISFDFTDNNPVFGDKGGQLNNANQFCGNCMLNLWRIDNIPSQNNFFDNTFNFNVSVLGGGYLCAADFQIYFPMKDIRAPTLTCVDQTYTFTSGQVKSILTTDVDKFITSTMDNCDWRGEDHAYKANDGFLNGKDSNGQNTYGAETLSIVNYPYKEVAPTRTDTSSNRQACPGKVLAWVNMSPYIIFYPPNPVQLKDYLVGATIGNPLDGTCQQYKNVGGTYLSINVNELKFDWYNKIWTRGGGTTPGVIVSNAKVIFYAVWADDENSQNPTTFYFNKDAPVPFSPEISSTYGEYRYTGSYSELAGKTWHLKMKVIQTRNGKDETIIFDSSCVTFVDPHAG